MTAELRLFLFQAAASPSADDMVRAGWAALEHRLYAEAVPQVERALRQHSADPRLWHLLGLLYQKLEDLSPAVAAFAKATELAPKDATIADGYACACYEAGLPATRRFESARRLAPLDRSILLRLAAAQIAEGRAEFAIKGLRRELLKEPRWVKGHAALSRVLWTRGDKDDFTSSFDRALASIPKDLTLWQAYINMLINVGLAERALSVIACGRASAGPQRLFDIAEAIVRTERGEGHAAANLFARLAPLREPDLLIHYIRLLLRLGHVAEAAALAEQEAPRDPQGRFWPYLSIGWRLLEDRRWEWLEGDPRFIGVYDIEASLPPLDRLAERLRILHDTSEAPPGQSVRGGTQTDGNLFSRIEPEIRSLRSAVVQAVERHVAQLPPPQELHPLLIPKRSPISFAGSWSVRLTGGGHHADHVHPAGWLSSALYIATPGDEDRGDGEAGWLALGQASELGIDMPPIRRVEPKPGRLVLFPSTMWHGTRAFGAGERLSVAFDVRRP